VPSSSDHKISQLSPTAVWTWFDTICSIPHPSKHEETLAHFIVEWATSMALDVRRDKTGNIIIKKAATHGMEQRKPVVLQAHLDMVPQKNEDTQHDFTQDPIQPYIDGEWVTAKGTTLGADNGIGMATCLAVLSSTTIQHGPLEVLLTIDEEAGMTGAFGLQPGELDADILLNTDSEQEGEVYVGCAGGINHVFTFTIERQPIPRDYVTYQLTLKGLKGGHSGCDINTGRGNANKLLARFLAAYTQKHILHLIDFRGGTLRNAIPREAFVTVAIPAAEQKELEHQFSMFTQTIKSELSKIETNLSTIINHVENKQPMLTLDSQRPFIALLNSCPNGVMRMSDEIDGVVETSLNVGVISTETDKITVLSLIRSLIDSGREQIELMLTSLAQLSGADSHFYGAYPGWKPDQNSEIMAIFRDLYEKNYGHKPNIMVIHAGLECGLFKKPYPAMDMVSFGPTIKFPHSPDEKVKIDTVALFWDQMVALLEAIPERS
jgi:dipeptidase D